MNDVYWRFRRSDDMELIIGGDSSPFRILSMSGIDTLKPEIYTKKRAHGDGSIVTSKRMPSREFSLTAELLDATRNQAYRDIINRFFSHRFTYDVTISYINEPRIAPGCELIQAKCPSGNIYVPLKPSITMLSPGGFFLSTDSFGKDIGGSRGCAAFPYINLVGSVSPVGVYEYKGSATITNDGDVEAYVKAVITFRGDVVNPKLTMGDRYIRVLDSFTIGDTLTIDSSERRIRKNGVSIDTRMEKGSSWDKLVFQVGENVLHYDADEGNNLMVVHVYFSKRYVGV